MTSSDDCTFIIPIKIDSDDRRRNCKIVLSYLLEEVKYRIMVAEIGSRELQSASYHNSPIFDYYHFDLGEGEPFHKTKYLNFLAKKANTPVICCYDIDVILPVDTYKTAVDMLIKDESDVIYPYNEGMFQKKVIVSNDVEKIKNIDDYPYQLGLSIYGHCNFQKKEVYEKAGYENENFISYGPEDQEKMYRYFRLGYRIGRTDNFIYHLEHSRGKDSEVYNPYYHNNMTLFEELKNMSDSDFRDYCNKLRLQ